jgi:hypothetical protein
MDNFSGLHEQFYQEFIDRWLTIALNLNSITVALFREALKSSVFPGWLPWEQCWI